MVGTESQIKTVWYSESSQLLARPKNILHILFRLDASESGENDEQLVGVVEPNSPDPAGPLQQRHVLFFLMGEARPQNFYVQTFFYLTVCKKTVRIY